MTLRDYKMLIHFKLMMCRASSFRGTWIFMLCCGIRRLLRNLLLAAEFPVFATFISNPGFFG